IGVELPDDVEVGEAGKHRLAADASVAERNDDLLVAAGQLRAHHDSVAPPRVVDPVAVAELALAGDDGSRRQDTDRRGGPAGQRSGWRPARERIAPRGEIATGPERLAGLWRARTAAPLPVGSAAGPDRGAEPRRPPGTEDKVEVERALGI